MKDLIRQIVEKHQHIYISFAKVLRVNIEGTCDVELLSKKILYDVRINPTANQGNDEYKIIPVTGSQVLVGIFPKSDRAIVLSVAEAEEIRFFRGDTTFIANSSGFILERNGQNLFSVLDDFITEVSKIIVVQGTSPNVPALTAVQQRLKTILDGTE